MPFLGVLLSVLLCFGCCLVPQSLATNTHRHTHTSHPIPQRLCRSPNIIPADYTPISIKSCLQSSSPPWLTPTIMHCNVFSMCLFHQSLSIFPPFNPWPLLLFSPGVSFPFIFFFLMSFLWFFTLLCVCNGFHIHSFLWISDTNNFFKGILKTDTN